MSSVLAVMRPTLQLTGCLRGPDVLLLLGWAVQADLYKDRWPSLWQKCLTLYSLLRTVMMTQKPVHR